MTYSEERQEPLYLSEEETIGLLDLCLPGISQANPVQERALHKLMALARPYIAATERTEVKEAEHQAVAAPQSAASACGFNPQTMAGARHDFDAVVVDRILASISA